MFRQYPLFDRFPLSSGLVGFEWESLDQTFKQVILFTLCWVHVITFFLTFQWWLLLGLAHTYFFIAQLLEAGLRSSGWRSFCLHISVTQLAGVLLLNTRICYVFIKKQDLLPLKVLKQTNVNKSLQNSLVSIFNYSPVKNCKIVRVTSCFLVP